MMKTPTKMDFARVEGSRQTREFDFLNSSIIGKLEFYRIDGSDKHIRDIHAILWNKPNLEYREDMEQWIVKRGLADVWANVLKEMT